MLSKQFLGSLRLAGSSEAIKRVYGDIEIASRHHFSALILGESGTGKELVAKIIHERTPRGSRRFIPVDCAALVSTLIESELFGYAQGAFTGAERSRIGLFEAANGGTLFLDEIGEMPLHCQVKLLRALQEHEVRPVGAAHAVPVDVRIIAATNRNLEAEVKAGRFRLDLYYRLNVLQIRLPALREHKSDIPLLVDLFLAKNQGLQSTIHSVSDGAMECLMSYDWPGNVRELEHAVQYALASSSGPAIEAHDLPHAVRSFCQAESLYHEADVLSLEELERRAIFCALNKTQGDKLAAARLLQIGKTTLYRKLKEYNAN